ncbi:MAG: MFS transporter [Syntrophales bacterium]|jgi:NNP family nitrate/nitrite transporter-like MFS transporter
MERYSNLRGKALLLLFFFWFIWFSTFTIRIVFAPILPLVEDEFRINHSLASSIFLFLSAGYGTAVLVAGFFSGKFGYKKSIVLSLGLLGLVALLVPLVQSFYLLYVFACVIGFSVGLYLPAAISLITEYYSEKNWGRAIAIHDTGAPTAIFATPFLALFLLHFFHWRGIFVALACIYLVSSIVFWFVSSEVKVTNPPKTVLSDLIKIKSLWLMAVIWVFGAGSNIGLYSVIPLYLTKELQLNIGQANTILGFSRLGAIGMALGCGLLMHRFNLRKIMSTVMIITGALTVLMGLASVRYIGIVLFLQAFFVTAFFPAGLVAIAKTFSREMRSLATGIILAVSMVSGAGIIPYLLGVSGDAISFRLGITILGILTVLSSRLIFNLKELE